MSPVWVWVWNVSYSGFGRFDLTRPQGARRRTTIGPFGSQVRFRCRG